MKLFARKNVPDNVIDKAIEKANEELQKHEQIPYIDIRKHKETGDYVVDYETKLPWWFGGFKMKRKNCGFILGGC